MVQAPGRCDTDHPRCQYSRYAGWGFLRDGRLSALPRSARPCATSSAARDRETAKRLWAISRALTRADYAILQPCQARVSLASPDRKSVVSGKSVSVRVDLGGRLILKKKKDTHNQINKY